MKAITKLRDLILYDSWFQYLLSALLYLGLSLVSQKWGYSWGGVSRLYIIVGLFCLILLTASSFIGLEYPDKVKTFFPKIIKEGMLKRLLKNKWTAPGIICLLSTIICFCIPHIGVPSAYLDGLFYLSFYIFLVSGMFSINRKAEFEPMVSRLILTKTKFIVYFGGTIEPKTKEYDLNNLVVRLETENQLSLRTVEEEEHGESTSIDIDGLQEEERLELLEVLLK